MATGYSGNGWEPNRMKLYGHRPLPNGVTTKVILIYAIVGLITISGWVWGAGASSLLGGMKAETARAKIERDIAIVSQKAAEAQAAADRQLVIKTATESIRRAELAMRTNLHEVAILNLRTFTALHPDGPDKIRLFNEMADKMMESVKENYRGQDSTAP